VRTVWFVSPWNSRTFNFSSFVSLPPATLVLACWLRALATMSRLFRFGSGQIAPAAAVFTNPDFFLTADKRIVGGDSTLQHAPPLRIDVQAVDQ
jgi:hypothetical protein